MGDENALDIDAAVAEAIELLTLRPGPDATWVGDAPDWFGDVLFGGFVIAQAIMAATRAAPEGRRLHSLHAYFLRPVLAASPLTYAVRAIREGRSFTSRHVVVTQDGKPVLELSCSFTADTDGYVYDLPARGDVPSPDDAALHSEGGPGPGSRRGSARRRPPPTARGSRRTASGSASRAELPDDVHLHTALLGFASDWTGVGGRPLHLDDDIQGMVSLDHAVWFHRPARADEWLLYDVHSLVNAGGRGLLRGAMHDANGHVVVSVAQEMRLTPYELL